MLTCSKPLQTTRLPAPQIELVLGPEPGAVGQAADDLKFGVRPNAEREGLKEGPRGGRGGGMEASADARGFWPRPRSEKASSNPKGLAGAVR